MKYSFSNFILISSAIGLTLVAPPPVSAQFPAGRLNGFELSNPKISPADILYGGQPADGIPAIDQPKFVMAAKAKYLREDDLVVSFSHEHETRAYPLRILVYHEIVNDTVGGLPIAVTYCPLCGTAMVFSRQAADQTLTFGVSGLLYQSDVLMYDRQSRSLWSQLLRQSVAGPLSGTKLKWLTSEHLTFSAWRARHPEGRVLSQRTGFSRNYRTWPYTSYENSPRTMFPVREFRQELPVKAWVVGVTLGSRAMAFPLAELPLGEPVTAKVGLREIQVTYDGVSKLVTVIDAQSKTTIPSVKAYWFAWQAFHPTTGLWNP